MQIISFNNLTVTFDPKERLLSNQEVSTWYGITTDHLKRTRARNLEELKEGTHWVKSSIKTKGGIQTSIQWTLEGLYLIGFFLKSKGAKDFRKYVSELLTDLDEGNKAIITKEQVDAIKRGYLSQLSQRDKKIELLEKKQKVLPPPSIDLAPYKNENKRLNDKVNELFDLKEHFSRMAGVQVFKTVAMMGVKDELIELQSQFLNNPKLYKIIGESIRKCQIIEQQTQENAQSFDIKTLQTA